MQKLNASNLTIVNKFFVLFFLGFFITAGIIVSNLSVALKLENNAVAINLSGNGRYRNYELYFLYDRLVSARNKTDRQAILDKIRVKTNELEQILVALRSGSKEYRLKGTGDKIINTKLDQVISSFEQDIKPIILKADNEDINQSELAAKIPQVVEDVDKLVKMYENSSIKQVKFLQRIQIAFMVITLIASVLVGMLLIYWIKKPIYGVISGMKELEGGNLDYRFREKRGDEIGMLIKGYNHMASQIKSKTEKLETISRELKVISVTDGLTGLFNHRHFYDVLENEMARGQRYDHPVSLLFIDIDLFKNLNDRFGHRRGDEVLRHVAKQISDSTRETDFAFRYGGEEFAVILVETQKQNALSSAEKIRQRIEQQKVKTDDGQVMEVTVSIGVASFPQDYSEYNGLVNAADKALYAAKDAGRNRCLMYHENMNEPVNSKI